MDWAKFEVVCFGACKLGLLLLRYFTASSFASVPFCLFFLFFCFFDFTLLTLVHSSLLVGSLLIEECVRSEYL